VKRQDWHWLPYMVPGDCTAPAEEPTQLPLDAWEPGDLMTVAEVVELTGWSTTSINRWARAGALPYERKLPGRTGSYVFRRSVIEQRVAPRGPMFGGLRQPATA
jgi:predicted DNA-binding transcriptional regulator AlpA